MDATQRPGTSTRGHTVGAVLDAVVAEYGYTVEGRGAYPYMSGVARGAMFVTYWKSPRGYPSFNIKDYMKKTDWVGLWALAFYAGVMVWACQ